MGVTIHFEGSLKTPKAYPLLMNELRDYADSRSWPCEIISEQHVSLQRVRNEQEWDYTGPTFGIQILPHPNADSLRFEFDENYFVQDFVKTQFAGVATHVAIIELFKRIQPFFEVIDVQDEGEFWASADESALAAHIQRCDQALRDFLKENPNARGSVRVEGRIIDLMN